MRRMLVVLIAGVLVTGCSSGSKGTGPGDSRAPTAQEQWDNKVGSDWENFSSGYVDGFASGCQALFDESPNGSLYENSTEYTVDDCTGLSPTDASQAEDVPTTIPSDPNS